MIKPLRLSIPSQIATERLQLRCPTIGDGAIIFETVRASLTELKIWMPWATDAYDQDGAEDWCRRAASAYLLGDTASYLIFLRTTKLHIGTITSFSKDWQVPKFEIGYWLATTQVGNGYMTEALRAVTQMTFDAIGARRIEIRTDLKTIAAPE